MLRYLGFGPRNFGRDPLKFITRMNWEFFAVIRGRTAPIFRTQDRPETEASTLWVFPPGSSHGWAGDGLQRSEITVFHFGSVPPELETAVRERGHLALTLDEAECAQLAELARRIEPDYESPNTTSALVFQGALIELSLLVLRKLSFDRTKVGSDYPKETVNAAVAWYSERTRANPSITEVARQVHVSASTLRRFFRQVRQESPVRTFAKIRLETAMHLLAETNLKLDTIATECGYSNTSDFCRSFKSGVKVTPSVWRRTILSPPKAARPE